MINGPILIEGNLTLTGGGHITLPNLLNSTITVTESVTIGNGTVLQVSVDTTNGLPTKVVVIQAGRTIGGTPIISVTGKKCVKATADQSDPSLLVLLLDSSGCHSTKGLSAGAIAGIVVGGVVCLSLLFLIFLLIVYSCCKTSILGRIFFRSRARRPKPAWWRVLALDTGTLGGYP